LCLRKRCAMRVWWGAVAQLGERLVRNEEVSGSIPLSSTIDSITCGAQLLNLRFEHRPQKIIDASLCSC
jgi:hypothetical protein